MVYVADGPSDVPVFSVVKRVVDVLMQFTYGNMEEFAQNDHLLQAGRIHSYGPADYTEGSSTANWIKLHLDKICEDVLIRQQRSLKKNVSKAPRHLPRKDQKDEPLVNPQPELFEGRLIDTGCCKSRMISCANIDHRVVYFDGVIPNTVA